MAPRAACRRHPLLLALAAGLVLAAALALAPGGCDRSSAPPAQSPAQPPPAAAGTSVAAPAAAPAPVQAQAPAPGAPPSDAAAAAAGTPAAAPVLLMLGDSLAAGYGLAPEAAFPALIQERLRAAGSPYRVVNAGVSGDTSAGGLSRLDWLLRQRVDILLLELGGNDGLRGLDPAATRDNLSKIIERAQARGITVILAGMQMPANYGEDYRRRFAALYPELARRYQIALIPFLLEGVAMRPELNQADGIHPNETGARIVADTVWKTLKTVLEKP